jgi:hypothetical protein
MPNKRNTPPTSLEPGSPIPTELRCPRNQPTTELSIARAMCEAAFGVMDIVLLRGCTP